jgi:hypothetical protein
MEDRGSSAPAFAALGFMGVSRDAVERRYGVARQFHSKAMNGGDAVCNRCANCMSPAFGEIDKPDFFTL